MAGKIFINYRRGDDPGNTGRLFDRLKEAFQPEQLFMDVDSIAPGLDFVRVLDEQVGQCDALLAVIGPRWLDATDHHGNRRLDDPSDYVRIEIESALTQDKRVIPVLVGDTRMPRLEELPEAIRPLARRNAVRLTHERFGGDAQGLIAALQRALEQVEAARQARAEMVRQAQAEEEREREEGAANARAEAQRNTEERARRDKEQARLTAIAGLSADQIAKAEELANWEFIKASASAQDFRDHLARFPRGVAERFARARLEEIVWAGLGAAPTLDQLSDFLVEFPQGTHTMDAVALEQELAEAKRLCERRQQETEAWVAASNPGDAATLAAFLKDWPEGQHTDAARARIKKLKRAPARRRLLRGLVVLGGAIGLMAVGGGTYVSLLPGFTLWRLLHDQSIPRSSQITTAEKNEEAARAEGVRRRAEQAEAEAKEAARRDPALSVTPGSGQSFRDRLVNGQPCPMCPELVVAPAGSFLMGSPASEPGRTNGEVQVRVTIARPLAVGKFAVTFAE